MILGSSPLCSVVGDDDEDFLLYLNVGRTLFKTENVVCIFPTSYKIYGYIVPIYLFKNVVEIVFVLVTQQILHDFEKSFFWSPPDYYPLQFLPCN